MTSTEQSTLPPSDSLRRTARLAGAIYLLSFVSIPTLTLYAAVKDPNYIVGSGPDNAALIGGLLEMVVALACIGTAVVLYPVLKRQNQTLALGFLGARILEAACIYAGIACLWTIVTLRQGGAGVDALAIGQALVALYDQLFLISQGMIPAINALLLGTLLLRSRLVPRVLPILGLIGAPLLITAAVGTIFGLWEPMSLIPAIATVPIALWEFSLGIWLVVRGFSPSPITTGMNYQR